MSAAFFERFAPHLLRNEPLAKYTAARIGGPADAVCIARDTALLEEIVRAAWAVDIPTRILGGGANVLISDAGFRGLVVIDRAAEADLHDDGRVIASGGYGLTVLAHKCAARGLAGLEWAASVPGTVGGAVVNNAGAHGGDMAALLVTALVLFAEDGQTRTLTNDDLAYGYRTSSLKTRADRRFLVLSAELRLTHDLPAAVEARMESFVAYRKRTQPAGASLGSIFKNPPGDYAGRLIEACGLKGYGIGGAQVSPVHANFFINRGGASGADYSALIDHVQAVVLRETGILLEPEIERIGFEN